MLRSNPSIRADARAWGAVLFLPLLITIHAWACPAINLLRLSSAYSPLAEPPWLPFGKISAAHHVHRSTAIPMLTGLLPERVFLPQWFEDHRQ